MKNYKLMLFLFLLIGGIMITLIPWVSRFTWISIGSLYIRFDYIFHFTMSLLLIFCFFWYNSRKKTTIQIYFLYTLVGLSFSYIVELLQLLIPYRSFDYKDFLFSSLGILVGSFIYWIYQHIIAPKIFKNQNIDLKIILDLLKQIVFKFKI